MPSTFSGHLSNAEQSEARRLVRWSAAERLILMVILGLGAGAGLLVPLFQNQRVQFLPLTLCAVMVAFLLGRQLQKRRLVQAVLSEPVEGVWDGDAIRGLGDHTFDSLHLSPQNLCDCRVGTDTLLIWSSKDRPTIISASVFEDEVDWAKLRALVGERCRVALNRRDLMLVGSVVGWLGLIIFAWASWNWWLR